MSDSLSVPFVSPRASRIAVSAIFFLQGLNFATWTSRIPSLQQKLHINNAELGGVLFAAPIGLMISLPLAGIWITRFGSKRVLIIAAILYTATLCLVGLANNAFTLAAVLFFFGFVGNLLNISVNTQAVGVEAAYARSIMASFHGLWSLGGFAGASLGTLMLGFAVIPFHHFLIVTAVSLLILFSSIKILLPEDVNKPAEKQPLLVLPDKSIVSLGIIAFCSMICEGCMFDWSGVYFKEVVLAERAMIGAGLTAFMFTMASGRFVADWVTTRLGIRKMLMIAGTLTAGGLLFAVLFPQILPALAGFLLVGLGVSSVVPLVYSAAGRSKKLPPGMAIAAVSTIGYLGFLIGPPFIGFIAEAFNLRLSFALISVLGLTIALLARFTRLS